MAVTFAHVEPDEAWGVFQWHRGFAAADNHLFPRTWEHYEALANDSQVVKASDERGLLGLAYYALDGSCWEVGGLMVAASKRGSGVGATLMRVTLGHLLFEENPLERGESVIAHVHRDNAKPRTIIEEHLRFQFTKHIQARSSDLPGLSADPDGFVYGDEFELSLPASLEALAVWCDSWRGVLLDGSSATIELRDGISLEVWSAAFRDMATRHS